MKRLCTCLLILTLGLSLTPAALGAETSFSDVPQSHWACDYVSAAADAGWVTGITATQYQPEGSVTGAQFLTMVVRAFYPGDIPAGVADPWYQPYVSAGDGHGLRDRIDLATAQALTTPLTRYQMAVIMDNLLIDAGLNAPAFEPGLVIGDWATVPAEYRNPVARTYALGLLTGTDVHGTFAGDSGMTRAQAAAVMCRLNELVPVQAPGTDPITPADMVSNQQLLALANRRIGEQHAFLYGLRPGAVFQQDWTPAYETPGDGGWPIQWFRVTEPGVSTLADIQAVWETYFARAWVIPQEYLANYREFNGVLHTCNPGIGGDLFFQKIQAEEVLSRTGGQAILRAAAYYDYSEFGGSPNHVVPFQYDMVWEDGQWKCAGLFEAE